MATAILSFIGWTHAAIIRLRNKNSAYNKYVLVWPLSFYVACNFIQADTFDHKTWFNVAFVLYSLIAIPLHIWLMITWARDKKTASH